MTHAIFQPVLEIGKKSKQNIVIVYKLIAFIVSLKIVHALFWVKCVPMRNTSKKNQNKMWPFKETENINAMCHSQDIRIDVLMNIVSGNGLLPVSTKP